MAFPIYLPTDVRPGQIDLGSRFLSKVMVAVRFRMNLVCFVEAN